MLFFIMDSPDVRSKKRDVVIESLVAENVKTVNITRRSLLAFDNWTLDI